MDIQTQIGAVTVYPDRALVTRTGTATLQNGAQEVVIAGLPAQLQTDSLRASGRGAVAVKIIGVEARERALTRPNSPTARDLQAQLEAAQDASRELQDAIERLDERAQTVRKLADESALRLARSLASGSDFERAAQLLDWVAAQLQQIDEQQAALKIRKREADAQQSALTRQLQQLQTAQENREKIVAVLVESAGAGEWELELSYIVSQAHWTPLYDARVATGENARFALSLNALVTQQSGENWENVALKLSTARPGLGSLPPKLDPIWVDEPRAIYTHAPRPAPAMAAPMMARSRVADDAVLEMAEVGGPEYEPIESTEVVADVQSAGEGATVEFALPYTLSVPGDGQAHRVAVAVRELEARFDYLAIPRRVELAYLRARATNSSDVALLAGEVSIFRDGVFVGRAHLKNTAPGGELELFLGPDEQIRARRELTARETDKNFIGKIRRVHFAYQIELHNLKAQPVTVEVRDQVPVSRSENIKVKLRGAAPEATASDLGVLEWKIGLNAGEKKTLRFDYGVESPRDTTITGLMD